MCHKIVGTVYFCVDFWCLCIRLFQGHLFHTFISFRSTDPSQKMDEIDEESSRSIEQSIDASLTTAVPSTSKGNIFLFNCFM